MRFPCFFVGLAMVSVLAVRGDFHVAPGGSDTDPGTARKPFATLERARDAVRSLTAGGKIPRGGLTVWMHGGDHVRTRPLELTGLDSGQAGAPVVWQAVKGESVRWLGGRRLETFRPVTDPGVLERLEPAARTNVLQVNLVAAGIDSVAGLKSRGFSRPLVDAHSELFVDGHPMPLARWPNEGWERIAGFPEGTGQGDDHGGRLGALPDGFFYAGDRPKRWRDVSDVWVHGYWAWDWANSYERVTELNTERRFIRTAAPHGLYGFRKGQRFQYLNVLEELDAPGEWFADRKSGMLYFWPPTGSVQTKKGRDVVLSLMAGPLLRMTGVSNVVVRGLVLEATRGSGVEIRGGMSNRVEGCLLRNVGNYGVVIEGGLGHGVAACDILDTGDGGVSLTGGDRATLTPGGHFVEDCRFERQGRWSKCYVPAVLMQGVGLRASHNRIVEHPHCAILFGGTDHRIEFNEIARIALETGDVGAIYAGRDYSFRGNRIEGNFIHDTGGIGMGSMGVYMDDCVSGTTVLGNIFLRVHWAMFIGGGRDHVVENNLFVDCDPAVRVDGRGLDPTPVWYSMVDDFMRRQLAAVPSELYRARYPALTGLDRHYGAPGETARVGDGFRGVPPEGNAVRHNLCVGKWLDVGWRATADMLDVRDNYVTTDRSQVGSESGGLKVPMNSPARAMGFEPTPMEKIGPRRGSTAAGRGCVASRSCRHRAAARSAPRRRCR